MLALDPGFRKDHLISLELDPSVRGYSADQTHDFYRKLSDRVESLPGVISVAKAETLPLSPSQTSVTAIPEGFEFPKGQESVTVLGGVFDENYFRTLRVAIVQGRSFSPHDSSSSERVAIVNQEFAKRYWPNQNALSKRIRLERADGPVAEVVGVAKTGRYFWPWESPQPYVYLPYEQNQRSRMLLIAESRGDPAGLAGPLRNAVHTLDPEQPVYTLRTVTSTVSWALNAWIVLVQMIGAMGVLGLVLALVGLYGVIAYSVSRRTAEIGVRMAVGADRAAVMMLVLRQGLTLALVGTIIGGAVAAVVAPALISGLAGVGVMSISTYIAVPVMLLMTTVAACYFPARRAAMLDPVRALRYE